MAVDVEPCETCGVARSADFQEVIRVRDELAADVIHLRADRDRLWSALWNAQNEWIASHDLTAHAGWQMVLVQTGPPHA